LLLERLQGRKNTIDLDGYVEVLEKFIRRVMDKEETLMQKLIKMQEKLEVETEKTERLTKASRKNEDTHRHH
jgi:hypothetical protein